MTNAARSRSLLYSTLLFAYPREFRQRFGSEMVATFSDQMGNERKRHGLVGVFRVWRCAVWEVFSVAAPLHLRRSIVVAGALSFLGSSALFLALLRAVSPSCRK